MQNADVRQPFPWLHTWQFILGLRLVEGKGDDDIHYQSKNSHEYHRIEDHTLYSAQQNEWDLKRLKSTDHTLNEVIILGTYVFSRNDADMSFVINLFTLMDKYTLRCVSTSTHNINANSVLA